MVAAVQQLSPNIARGSSLTSVFEQASTGCAIIDSNGRLVSVTRSFAEMLDCQDTQLFDQNIFDVFDGLIQSPHKKLPADGKDVIVSLNGGRRLLWSMHKIASGNVLAGYYIGLLSDENNPEDPECAAAHSDRLSLLGQSVAEVTHEIAGPLSVIANNAELLLDEGTLDQFAQQSVALICEEAHRLGRLLRDVLCFAGNSPIRLIDLDLAPIVKKSVDLFQSHPDSNGITLRIEAEPNLPSVAGDADRLQQVIFNLLTNARHASPDKSEILITARLGEMRPNVRAIEIEILDQGDGIAPRDAGDIFKPFVSRKPFGKGTGLGLPIAQHVVRAHGGELRLESSPGKGTRASILLPVCSSNSEMKKPGSEPCVLVRRDERN